MAALVDASKVLGHIRAIYAGWCEPDSDLPQPRILPGSHEGLGPGTFVIVWEEGPEDWALLVTEGLNVRDEPVYCEPIFSFTLGIYDR